MKLPPTFIRLSKFSGFTLLGTMVDTLVLWLCSDYLLNGYVGEYIISPLISFEAANLTNYLVSTRFVWKDRMKGCSRSLFWKKYAVYNASNSMVFFIKMGVLLLIQAATKLDVVWCNILALLVSGLMNFEINDKVIFRKKKLTASIYGSKTIETNSDIHSQWD